MSQLTNLPTGWTIATLDELSSKITSGSRDWSSYYGRGTSVFVLAQNVRPLVPDFSVRQFVDPPRNDPSRDRSRVETRDLLATIVGANTGQVCLVVTAPEDAYVCQSVALIRPATTDISSYLNYWLNSEEHGQRYFERCMYGQGRPHLSFEQLMATPIALPPVGEQQRIVAEVDRCLSLVHGVEVEMKDNLKRSELLRQSTLAQAFSANSSHARV
jgi:type I restriction enzyme S subunit